MSIGKIMKQRAYTKKVRDWPECKGCALEITLHPPVLNGLKFRSHMDEARFLGRPSEVTVIGSGSTVKLEFSPHGLCLEYENDRLVYVGIVISPQDDVSSGPGMDPARARLLHGNPVTLAPDMTAQRVVDIIGRAATVDSDKEETLLTHEIDGYTVEFEFTPQNTLKRFNMFPT